MVKFFKATILVLVLGLAACSAEPQRLRQSRKLQQRRTKLARQEVLEVAPTPYPSAAELKPEVPFDEAAVAATEFEHQPDQTYGPPDQTYGPPEVEQEEDIESSSVDSELPSEDAPEEFAPPTANPEAEEFGSAEVTTASSVVSSRLISKRRRVVAAAAPLRKQRVVSSRLRLRATKSAQKKRVSQRLIAAAPVVAAAPAPVQVVATPSVSLLAPQQQYYVVNQPFAYTAQYQSW